MGVGALIIDGDKILLVERGHEPLKGWWSLPGGGVETGERIEFALRREIREETGLEVEILCLLEIFERIMHDAEGNTEYHYVLADYICRPIGGRMHAADDASKAEWIAKADLSNYRITEGTPAVIAKAFAWLRINADEAANPPARSQMD